MKVAVRVDASTRIGLGHLMRCRTLATALRDQGAEVRFVCRAHPGHGIAMLQAEGFPVATLPEPPVADAAIADADYAGWRGVTQARDAHETLAALADWRPDWLIVDHYGLDHAWEQALRTHTEQILVIDDLANRRHDADLLLDQNHVADAENRYETLLPPSAERLLGPRYALLRPEYARSRCARQLRDGQVRRVLVFFGGTDPDDLTGRALAALDDPALVYLKVDLVVGANNPHRDRLADRVVDRPGAVLHGPRPHLADLMSEADFAIGAGGATTWERCCLGLPSLVISIAENQRRACAALAVAGFIQYLGHQDQVTVAIIRKAMLGLIANPGKLRILSNACANLVDGNGTARVIEAMRQHTKRPVMPCH